MTLFIITFIIFAVVIGIMSIGVIFGRSSIKGSCGGAGNGECLCAQGKNECKQPVQSLKEEGV